MALGRYCRKAGVWITCHQLRHSFGRHLVEAGMAATSLRQLLCHQHIRTTDLYIHISTRKVQADYKAATAQVIRLHAVLGGHPSGMKHLLWDLSFVTLYGQD